MKGSQKFKKEVIMKNQMHLKDKFSSLCFCMEGFLLICEVLFIGRGQEGGIQPVGAIFIQNR